jgi:predicted Zn-dependent peptidase
MEYKKDILKNGVRLLTIPMPHLASVTAMIGVGAGGRYEDARTQGIAHFTEHMLFNGTEKRPSSFAISSELESLGAHFNAFTDKEITAYYVKAESKNLPKVLDVLTDMVFNSKFDQKEIEKESRVIIEELRMYRDEPRSWINMLSDQLIFEGNPLGWEILGTEETLTSIKREDFLDYLNNWYRSRNITVAVAGRIGEEKALEEVREVLGRRERGDVAVLEKFTAAQKEPAVMLEERKTDQTHFILGVRAYHRFHPKREALEVLISALGGGMSSRLFQEIREKRGLAYYVHADWQDFSDTGALQIGAGVNNQKAVDAVEAVVMELKKLKDTPVPTEELKKAKEMLRGSLVLGLESTSGACSYFLGQEVLEGKVETPEEKLKKIDAVTADDVQKVAQEIFVTKGLNLALIGPFSDSDRFRHLLALS